MPALAQLSDAASPRTNGLAPREPDASDLTARQPAIHLSSEGTAIADIPKERAIQPRQTVTSIIPTYYKIDGPGSGAVIGIVLGSVAGFLFIIWLLWTLTNVGGGANIAGEEEVVVRRRRNSHGGRSRRSTRTEVREYSRSPRRSGGRSTVIVEERRAPRPRSIVVEERVRVPGDDIVEVEYDDEYRTRRGSRRGSYR